MKYLLLFTIIPCIFCQELEVKQTLFGKYQEQNFFCVVFQVNESTPDYLDIIGDETENTYDHFILRQEDYISYSKREDLLSLEKFEGTILRWYGKFKSSQKGLTGNIVSLIQRKWKKNLSFAIDFPDKLDENKNLHREWGIARNHLYQKYRCLLKDNEFLKYGLLSSSNQFEISVAIPEEWHFDDEINSFRDVAKIRNEFLMSFRYQNTPDIDIQTIKKTISETGENSKKANVYGMTKIVPEDYYFLHVNSPDSLFATIEKFSNCKDDSLSLFSSNGKTTKTMEKILGTLAIFFEEESGGGSGFGRDLLGWVIGDLGVVGSDFTYGDGTSYAIVVYVKSKFLLDMQLNKYFNKAKSKGASVKNISYNGYSFQKIIDDKRGIFCHTGYINSFLILSNSEKMICKIIDTATNKNNSLAKSNDLQTVRNIFPAKEIDEDAFFYISKAFLDKMSSPEYQVSRMRRHICAKNLNHLKYAALHYHNDYRKEALSIDEPKEKNILFPTDIMCPDSGKYSLSHNKPVCSIHGRLDYLTPIDETFPDKLYLKEKTIYDNFIADFQGYESATSPLAIRSTPSKNLQLEVFTPGNNLPYFQDIQSYIATDKNTKVTSYNIPNTFLRFQLFCRTEKILESASVQEYLQKLSFPYFKKILPSLGEQITLYFCDEKITFTPVFNENSSTNLGYFSELPFCATIDIKNVYKLISTMDSLQEEIYAYSVTKKKDVELLRSNYNKRDYHIISTSWQGEKYRLFLAVLPDVFVITNDKKILYSFVDGKFSKETRTPENIELFFFPREMQKIREKLDFESDDYIRSQCFENQQMWNFYQRFIHLPNEIKKSKDYFASIDQQNLYDVLGYKEIKCPLNQQYEETNYNITCPAHGNHFNPLNFDVQKIKQKSFIWPNTSVRLKTTPDGITATIELEIK